MEQQDILAEIANLKQRFADMDAREANAKRDSFIDSDSHYFNGDREITGRIFDGLRERGIDTSNLDVAAREGIYNDLRNRLNTLVEQISVKTQEAQELAQQAQITAEQTAADVKQQALDMQQTLNAVTSAEGMDTSDSGIAPNTDMGMPTQEPMPTEMPVEGATEMPPEVPAEGGEMPTEVPTEVPAEGAEGGEVATDIPADVPQEVPTTVSDKNMKNILSERRLAGDTHCSPKTLSKSKQDKLDAWRKSRKVPTPPQPKNATVSDKKTKDIKGHKFSRNLINACSRI